MKNFEPVYDKNSRVLILGSFPSVVSRKEGFYYANKQNRFWRTLSKIFDEQIAEDKISKQNFLLKHKIALYDIVKSTNLVGSADNNLAKSKNLYSDITILLPPFTQIEKTLCNGKVAFDLTTQF